MIYPNAQNRWYDSVPEGWSADAISINGGHFGWGDAMTADQVLDMEPGKIRAFVERDVLPIIGGRQKPIIVLDLEKPINPSHSRGWPLLMLFRLGTAINRRFSVTREVLEENGIEPTLLMWWGARNWQDDPTVDDNQSLITMGILKEYGAFTHADGVAFRVYPPVNPEHRTWRRLETVTRNGHRAAESVFGRDAFIMPQFSLETHPGGDSLTHVVDEMAEIGVKVSGRAGFWSVLPHTSFQPSDVVTGGDS